MKRAWFPAMIAALCVTGFAGWGARVQEPNPIAKIVTTKSEAFAVFPAQMVVPGLVREFSISPDGRFILAVRVDVPRAKTSFFLTERELFEENFPPTMFISVVDRLRDQTFELHRVSTKDLIDFGVEWSGEPGVALLHTGYATLRSDESVDRTFSILRVSAADRSTRLIASYRPTDRSDPTLSVVPKAPYFYVHSPVYTMENRRWKYVRTDIQMFDTKGKEVAKMSTIDPVFQYIRGQKFQYLKDGVTPVVATATPTVASEGQRPAPRVTNWVIDVRNQAVTNSEERLELYEENWSSELVFSRGRHVLELGGAREVLDGLWLNAVEPSERPRVFLDVHPDSGELAPDLTYLAYVANGALFVRPIERMSLSEFRIAEETSVKTKAMRNAKMVGIAANIYAADYDDYFPMAHNFKDALMPYVKNESIFEGFIYVYTGGSLNSINGVATTVMGYVETPFGRAVVYADSSVRWEPNK